MSSVLVTPAVGALLREILAAHRSGLGAWAAQPIVLPGSTDDDVAQRVTSMLAPSDLDVLREATTHRVRAIRAARDGRPSVAEQELHALRAVSGARALSHFGTLVCRTLDDAAIAYVDYRGGRSDDARACLRSATLATNELCGMGVSFGESRRIHLANNLVHLEAQSGAAARAVELAGLLLSYIEGDTDAWPMPGTDLATPAESPTPAMRHQHAVTATQEIALALVNATADDAVLLEPLSAHIAGNALSQCTSFPRPHAWLDLKWHYLHRHETEFLAGAADFLRAGPGSSSILWHATARDVHALCIELATNDAAALAGYLAKVSASVTNVPPAFRIAEPTLHRTSR